MKKLKSTVVKFPKDMEMQLTRSFKLSEFKCRCSRDTCGHTLIDLEHLVDLQKLRDDLGEPIHITSAYRCEAHNKAVGGVKDSTHTRGLATDVTVSNMAPKALAEAAGSFNGVGIYTDQNFVHLDSRELDNGFARWGK